MTCPRCGFENGAEVTVCGRCRSKLPRTRPGCQSLSDIERNIWFQWVMLTTVGWVAGGLLSMLGPYAYECLPETIGGLISRLVESFALPAGVAAIQWIVLRRHVSGARKWILCNGVAGLFTFVVLTILEVRVFYSLPTRSFLEEIIHMVVIGGLLGVGQWMAMRRWVHYAGWWICGNVVGITVGKLAGKLVPFHLNTAFLSSLLQIVVSIGVYAAVTGYALVVLLRDPLRPHLMRAMKANAMTSRGSGKIDDPPPS